MALRLPGQWLWDSWFAFDGTLHHVFYLQASRALHDPNRRHMNPSIGHAVSTNLTDWTVMADAICPSEDPAAFDSWTTWTGSVVRDDSGLWFMFYTGNSRATGGRRQTIGAATSTDLFTWHKLDTNPLLTAHPDWYATLGSASPRNEDFRDPWVFRDPTDPTTWRMILTARANFGPDRQDAVMGHATSKNLYQWTPQPPLTMPGQGFGETEVFQFAQVDGTPLVLFCCGPQWLSQERLARGERGGIYSLPVDRELRGLDLSRARLFEAPGFAAPPDQGSVVGGGAGASVGIEPALYAPRLVQDQAGGWNLLAFKNVIDGQFVGELCDPIAVTADPWLGLVAV